MDGGGALSIGGVLSTSAIETKPNGSCVAAVEEGETSLALFASVSATITNCKWSVMTTDRRDHTTCLYPWTIFDGFAHLFKLFGGHNDDSSAAIFELALQLDFNRQLLLLIFRTQLLHGLKAVDTALQAPPSNVPPTSEVTKSAPLGRTMAKTSPLRKPRRWR